MLCVSLAAPSQSEPLLLVCTLKIWRNAMNYAGS